MFDGCGICNAVNEKQPFLTGNRLFDGSDVWNCIRSIGNSGFLFYSNIGFNKKIQREKAFNVNPFHYCNRKS